MSQEEHRQGDLRIGGWMSLLRERRSIRAFDSRDVDGDTVKLLVEAFRWAPSGGNAQPWKLFVVRSSELRARLCSAALAQSFIAKAPVVFVVCADLERARKAYGARGETLYCVQDTAAATQNLLLAAHAIGLGACWVGAFREASVADALALPAHLRPVALVPVGWPAERPGAPSRRNATEIAEER